MIRSFFKCALPVLVLASSGCAVDPTDETSGPEGQEIAEAQQAITFAIPDLHTTFFTPPPVGNGDHDFGGHGPRMSFGVSVVAEGNQLVAYVNLDGIETKSDWTHVTGSQRQILYTAPLPITIVSGTQPTSFTWSYTDTNHNPDNWGFPETSNPQRLVKFLHCLGDNSGDDVWKTGCSVDFHPITIQY